MKSGRVVLSALCTVSLVATSACVTDPNTGHRKVSRTAIGAGAGIVGGLVIGGLLGGGTGRIIGAGIGELFNGLLAIAASKFGGQAVSLFAYPLTFLIFITVFSGGVGLLTGLFPARRAAKINPLDAIRYK